MARKMLTPKLMKTLFVVLLLVAAQARATLIDLTPGGFSLVDPWPAVVVEFFDRYQYGQDNLAGALIENGQVTWSPFTIFGPANFGITPNGAFANVSWDLANAQGGFHLSFVFVETRDYVAHLFAVPGLDRLDGSGFVMADGIINVSAITFVGDNIVPDSGSTAALLLIGIALSCLVYRSSRTSWDETHDQ